MRRCRSISAVAAASGERSGGDLVDLAALRSYSDEVLTLPGPDLPDAIDRFVIERASGGATYDALIAVTALHHGASLLTRDERAAEVYERLGADVMWVAT